MIKYFKNYNKDVLSWDEIINELWKAVDENQHVKHWTSETGRHCHIGQTLKICHKR